MLLPVLLHAPPRPTNVLALLLGGALVLSLGLNGWLLAAGPVAEAPDENTAELAAATADLHLTRRLLSQCQTAQQQRLDSLLVRLRPPAAPPARPLLADR